MNSKISRDAERETMKRKKIIEQLKKLKVMIDRGATDGERAAAQHIFDALCQANSITPDELCDVRSVRFFTCKTEYERRLLLQIVCAVLNVHSSDAGFSVWKEGRKRNSRGFELTEAEFVKVERLYRIYRKDFQKEVERTYRAFVQANNIFPAAQRQAEQERILTQEEYDDLCRVVSLSEMMRKSRVNAEIAGRTA